jgi:hypothetical protein
MRHILLRLLIVVLWCGVDAVGNLYVADTDRVLKYVPQP